MIENITPEQPKTWQEENLVKVKIEGNNITLGEGQASYQDVFNTYLIGPKSSQGDVDIFEELENLRTPYKVLSGGYLSCTEVTGSFSIKHSFFVHAVDSRNLKAHLEKIFELAEEKPETIVVKMDDSRADKEGIMQTLKKLVGNEVEIIKETF